MPPERTVTEAWLQAAEADFSVLPILEQAKKWPHGCYFACMSVEKFGKYLLLAQGESIDLVKQMRHKLGAIWERVETLYGGSVQLTDLLNELTRIPEYGNESQGQFSYRYPAGKRIPSDFLDEPKFRTHHRIATDARDLALALSESAI